MGCGSGVGRETFPKMDLEITLNANGRGSSEVIKLEPPFIISGSGFAMASLCRQLNWKPGGIGLNGFGVVMIVGDEDQMRADADRVQRERDDRILAEAQAIRTRRGFGS